MPKPLPQLMTTDETAAYLRRSPATLKTWRSRGGGPAFIKAGKEALYDTADVAAYLESGKTNPKKKGSSEA